MNQQLRTCANCGSSIGRLEKTYRYKDQPICQTCAAKLSKGKTGGGRPDQPIDSYEVTTPPPGRVAPAPSASVSRGGSHASEGRPRRRRGGTSSGVKVVLFGMIGMVVIFAAVFLIYKYSTPTGDPKGDATKLVDQLVDPNEVARAEARKQIRDMGVDAIPALGKALRTTTNADHKAAILNIFMDIPSMADKGSAYIGERIDKDADVAIRRLSLRVAMKNKLGEPLLGAIQSAEANEKDVAFKKELLDAIKEINPAAVPKPEDKKEAGSPMKEGDSASASGAPAGWRIILPSQDIKESGDIQNIHIKSDKWRIVWTANLPGQAPKTVAKAKPVESEKNSNEPIITDRFADPDPKSESTPAVKETEPIAAPIRGDDDDKKDDDKPAPVAVVRTLEITLMDQKGNVLAEKVLLKNGPGQGMVEIPAKFGRGSYELSLKVDKLECKIEIQEKIN